MKTSNEKNAIALNVGERELPIKVQVSTNGSVFTEIRSETFFECVPLLYSVSNEGDYLGLIFKVTYRGNSYGSRFDLKVCKMEGAGATFNWWRDLIGEAMSELHDQITREKEAAR